MDLRLPAFLALFALMAGFASAGALTLYSPYLFSNGVFNSTYMNNSASVYCMLYANSSFASSGNYFSQPMVMNTTVAQSVTALNWSWYEALGVNVSEAPQIDLHFENDTVDSSPYNNSATASTGATLILRSDCIEGFCYNFNAVNSSVNITQKASMNISRQASISMWVYIKNLSSANRMVLADNSEVSPGSNGGFSLTVTSGVNKIAFSVGNSAGAGSPTWTTVNNLKDLQWNHVMVTYSDSPYGPSIYINGVNQTLVPTAGTQPLNWNRYPLYVGSGFVGASINSPFNGSIDEFTVWNRSLTAAEVLGVYSSGLGAVKGDNGYVQNYTNVSIALRVKSYSFNSSGLVGWWDLGDSSDNETVANKSFDLSGNGLNLGFNSYKSGQPMVLNTSGIIGKALNFTNYAYAWTDSFNLALVQNITIAMWVRTPAAGPAPAYLLDVRYNNSLGYFIRMNNPPAVQFYVNNSVVTAASKLVLPEAWVYLVAEANATNVSLYINGSLASRVAIVCPIAGCMNGAGLSTLAIATIFNKTQGFLNGSVDDVKIWNRTLSDAEISVLYNSSNPTGAGGYEGNWTVWSSEYYNGNATSTGVSGNVLQYRATFSSTSLNYSAFLQNLTILYKYIAPQNGPQSSSLYNSSNYSCQYSNLSVNWTDTVALTNATLEFDNGSGVTVNVSTFSHAPGTLTNQTNFTVFLNCTGNTTIRWRVWQNDSISNMSVTSFQSFNTTGTIAPRWSLPTQSNTTNNSLSVLSVYWIDDASLQTAILSFDNCTGTFVNVSTFVHVQGTVSNYTNFTVRLNVTAGCAVRWEVWQNDSFGNMNVTGIQSFNTTGPGGNYIGPEFIGLGVIGLASVGAFYRWRNYNVQKYSQRKGFIRLI